jgi:acetyltransferase-like isoleucine patch superfamily enzyme
MPSKPSKAAPFKAVLRNAASIIFENPVSMHPSVCIEGIATIGAYSYIGMGSLMGRCIIGRFCSIGQNVSIALGEHPTHHISTHPIFFNQKMGHNIPDSIGTPRKLEERRYQPPVISHDVWIGANAVICRGVHIGIGAVIAAGAVVTRNVEPYAIVGGVPARFIKYRFDEATRTMLIKSRWWDHPLTHFIGLRADEPKSFVEALPPLDTPCIYECAQFSSNRFDLLSRSINWNVLDLTQQNAAFSD